MEYLPLTLGLMTAFCWGTSDFLSKRQSERIGPYMTAVFAQAMTLLMLLLVLPVLTQHVVVGQAQVAVLVASGILNFFAFIFLYRAFNTGTVSVVAPIAYTYPAVTSVLSVVLLGVVIGPGKGLAIGGVILGIVLLSTRFSDLRRRFAKGGSSLNATSGLWPAVASSLSFGAVYVGIGYAAPASGYVVPAVFLRGVGVVTGVCLAPAFGQRFGDLRAFASRTNLVMGVLETTGLLTFTYGISQSSGSLPVVAALSGMGGAFAAGYATIFLKERLEWNQVLGVLLSLAGVFALLLLGG